MINRHCRSDFVLRVCFGFPFVLGGFVLAEIILDPFEMADVGFVVFGLSVVFLVLNAGMGESNSVGHLDGRQH